jgi:hypothetical protein
MQTTFKTTDTEHPSDLVTAPWWWPVVEAELAPRITAVAGDRGYSQTMMVQRVWAVLESIIAQSFSTKTLEVLFPDIPVAHVPPWEVRKTFATAFQESQEMSLAHFALERLACVVRDGTLPPRRRCRPYRRRRRQNLRTGAWCSPARPLVPTWFSSEVPTRVMWGPLPTRRIKSTSTFALSWRPASAMGSSARPCGQARQPMPPHMKTTPPFWMAVS